MPAPAGEGQSAGEAHLAAAERAATARSVVDADAPPVHAVGIIGAGTMGAGIALCYARAGVAVRVLDTNAQSLEQGLARVRAHCDSALAKGRLTQAQRDSAVALVTPASDYTAFADVDLVVEAAFEDLPLKQEIFAHLGRVTRSDCLLASNTSTLDIDALAEASGRPSTVVGHHFFSPAHVMRLLEIVRGGHTDAATIAASRALAARLGKVGVVVGNCVGFVANRLLGYYMREAYLLLEEGAPVEQIDRALTTFGMVVGPFTMQDIAGLDVGARMRQQLAAMGKSRADGPQSTVPDQLFTLGRYGQKTQAGWYRYEPGSRTPIPDPLVNDIAAEAAASRGARRRAQIPDEEIVSRVFTAVVNEAFRVLEEGHVDRAGDIDVIYCNGFGFPRARGGPMFWADTVGLPTVLSRVRQYQGQFGEYWRPAPLLERFVRDRRPLFGHDSQK